MTGEGSCYATMDARTLVDGLKGCHSDWRNIVIEDTSGLPPVYSSLFPRAGTYGARCTDSRKIDTVSSGEVDVECIEIAYSDGGKKKVVIVGDKPALGTLYEIETMPEYRDAVVLPG